MSPPRLSEWIARTLRDEDAGPPPPGSEVPVSGAFVRLTAAGREVGFLGTVDRRGPLHAVALALAREALTGDPRGSEVPPEAPLEVAVWRVGALRPLEAPEDLRPGEEGVVVHAGFKRAVHLPGLHAEDAGDARTFVESACISAGIGPGGWRREGTTLEAFEVARVE